MKFKNYIETESGIKDTSTSPGTAGQLLSSTVAGTSWIDQNTISSGSSEVVDIQVKNIASADGGVNLSKGDPVYIYGSVGASARLYVDLADADSTATNNLGDSKMPCVALLDQDLAPNIEGTATVVGKLRNLITSPIDGSVPSENDTVYVKSGGGLTLTKPTGSTNLIQNVGQVGRVSTSSSGNIVVAALLRTNDVPNLPEGRIWIGDGNTIVSDTVYVDEPNNRVGIGTTDPQAKLHVANGTLRTWTPTSGTSAIFESTVSNRNFLTLTATNEAELWFGDATTQAKGRIRYEISDGLLNLERMEFWTDAAQRMVIDGSGDVGIGAENPGEKLHVSGSGGVRLQVESTDSYDAALKLTNTAGSYGSLVNSSGSLNTFDYVASSIRTTLLANGNFGINATSPGAKLEVVGTTGVIIDSGSSSAAKLTLIGDGSPFGGGASIDVIGGSNDYLSYILNIKRSPSTLEASNSYFQYNAGWEWNGNQSNSRAQPYTSYSFRSQGSSQMVIYNNNLGIGVTTPSQKLHVNGNARVTGSYYDSSNSPGAANSVLISTISGTVWGARGPLGGGTTNYLARWTPDGNTLGIGVTYDNGTSVGIGTTSPGTYKLAVAGSTAIGENLEVSDGLGGDKTLSIDATVGTFQIGDIDGIGDEAYVEGDSSSIKVFTGGGETLVCDINQRVGIGVPNPSQKLEVAGNVLLKNGNSSYLYLNNTGMFLYGDAYGNTIIRSSNNFRIQTKTGGGESVRVNSSGDVGIGTTIPSEKLTVGGNISIASPNSFLVKNGDSNHGLKYGYNTFASNPTDGPILYGYDAGGLGTKRSSENIALYWNYLGNVGIGTTDPNHELVVEGASSPNIELKNTSYSNGGFVLNRANYTQQWKWWAESSQMYFGFSTDESTYSNKLLIKSNGNVGIGATNPSEKLDVVGNIKVSGDQYFNGAAIYGDNKEIIRYSDTWLRINPANNFTNGIYCGSGILRTDGIFQVGPSGSKFVVNSIGNVGINGTPSTTTSTKLKVYGTITSTGGSGFQIENGYGNPRLGDFYGSFTTTHPLYVGSPYSGLACHASAFNITSDYRLKENEALLTEASSRIKKLKPIRFNYINSENTVDGFLAHEVAEVIPEAVTGEKDAIREDGSDELQGLDLSKIVPLLTAALQESITKIEKLEQRIQTLENK